MRKRKGNEQREQQVKTTMAQKLAQELSLPENAFTSAPQLELVGNREAVIDGCKKILEYDENRVKIDTGKLTICFTGQRLQLRCMTAQSAVVEGIIASIDFAT